MTLPTVAQNCTVTGCCQSGNFTQNWVNECNRDVTPTTIDRCRWSEILFLLSYLARGSLVTVLETWKCSRCGEVHSGIPGYSVDAPWPWYTTPEKREEPRLPWHTYTSGCGPLTIARPSLLRCLKVNLRLLQAFDKNQHEDHRSITPSVESSYPKASGWKRMPEEMSGKTWQLSGPGAVR
jgi:hypothetical protein